MHSRKLFCLSKYRGTVTREVVFFRSSGLMLGMSTHAVLKRTRQQHQWKQYDVDDDILRLIRGKYIFCGTAKGRLVARDPRGYRVEHTTQAHKCAITDLDAVGNYVVTCGIALA